MRRNVDVSIDALTVNAVKRCQHCKVLRGRGNAAKVLQSRGTIQQCSVDTNGLTENT